MLNTFRFTTVPEKCTVPEAGATTVPEPGVKSTPRWPADHWAAGGSKCLTTEAWTSTGCNQEPGGGDITDAGPAKKLVTSEKMMAA